MLCLAGLRVWGPHSASSLSAQMLSDSTGHPHLPDLRPHSVSGLRQRSIHLQTMELHAGTWPSRRQCLTACQRCQCLQRLYLCLRGHAVLPTCTTCNSRHSSCSTLSGAPLACRHHYLQQVSCWVWVASKLGLATVQLLKQAMPLGSYLSRRQAESQDY